MDFIERDINDFNNKLLNKFNLMSINGYTRVIGSSNLKKIRYNSDYDLSTNLEGDEDLTNLILKRFQKIFILGKKDKNMFITDFKCGEDNKGEPIRWEYKDMMNSYKVIDGKKYLFTNCLLQKSTIKIDIIFLINNKFVETSDNYYFKFGKKTNFEEITKESIKESIENEYKELIKEKRFYKALKREFSLLFLEKRDLKRLNTLVDYFNSDIGILNQVSSDLSILILLLTGQNFRNPKLKDIKNNIQIIKQNASYASEFELSKLLNKASKSSKEDLIIILNKIINKLNKYINEDAFKNWF